MTKCISILVDKIPPMAARTQNASQQVFTKPLNAREDKKRFHENVLTKSHHTTEGTNASHHVLTMLATEQNVSQLKIGRASCRERV